jgi:site-specific recombinase XerD
MQGTPLSQAPRFQSQSILFNLNQSDGTLHKKLRTMAKLLNFAKTTIYNDPKYIKRFTDYLKASGVKKIQDTENRHIKDYYNYLKVRPNKRKSGALSQNT